MRRAILLALAFGCGGDLTELVVVIESDLAIPSELQRIDLVVTGPDGSTVVDQTLDFTLPGAPMPPLTLGLVQEGEAGPVVAEAIGMTATGGVISRSMSTSFVDGEIRTLSLPLQSSCIDVPCGAGMTCNAGTCESHEVPGDSLPSFP